MAGAQRFANGDPWRRLRETLKQSVNEHYLFAVRSASGLLNEVRLLICLVLVLSGLEGSGGKWGV